MRIVEAGQKNRSYFIYLYISRFRTTIDINLMYNNSQFFSEMCAAHGAIQANRPISGAVFKILDNR